MDPTVLDWTQPWWAPYRVVGQSLWQSVGQGHHTDEALELARNRLLSLTDWRFVSQAVLPVGESYEAFIARTQSIPTRDNLHDFFNGLCWLQFPQTKKKLNALQAHEIARAGVQPVRGPVRDALTVFDENAAFLQGASAEMWEALSQKDWHRLFIDLRAQWSDVRLVLFGHALLEKLAQPRKAITAHVYMMDSAIESIANLDAWVAADLSADKLATKPFAPLPVLGVPGWWPANDKPDFYADPQVFRPPATSRAKLG